MKVRNIVSRKGNSVANQFVIEDDRGAVWFQSYNSMIAVVGRDGVIRLDRKYWDYSNTTMKHLNTFLGTTSKKEILNYINTGVYELANLN